MIDDIQCEAWNETFNEIINDVKRKTLAEAWNKARFEAQKDLLIKLIKGCMPLEQLSQTLDIPISDLKAFKALNVDGK